MPITDGQGLKDLPGGIKEHVCSAVTLIARAGTQGCNLQDFIPIGLLLLGVTPLIPVYQSSFYPSLPALLITALALVTASASHNLLILSKCDPKNSPEYSEYLYLCGDH